MTPAQGSTGLDRSAARRKGRARWVRAVGAALAAALAIVLVLGGCRPRTIEPHTASLLVQPDRDLLAYRRLVLDNGLRVMLISNPRADQSAAAMAVRVGSLDDPNDRPGLAHFLEHMLFLGTEKYPQANAYSKYLAAHGGWSNAYTAGDHTNYFFSVDNDALQGALDRFAQFFIAPRFNQEYMDREMRAVDAEHGKNVDNDYWRTQQVVRIHYDHDHPISRFSTGTLQTLGGVTRDEILRFYRQHYSANLMTLAVAGNADLDALEKLVRSRFAAVKDRKLKAPHYPEQYLAHKAALRVVKVAPLAERRSLTLHFPLPPVEQDYESKPLQMIGSVLGHEGEGSLLSLLKKEGLALSLSAGASDSTADYSGFEINVGLTPKGLAHYHEVIRTVLGAVDGLRERGVPRYLFDEYRTMNALEYRFRDVPPSASLARRMSAMMQRYPLEALPDEPLLLRRYAPDEYRDLLKRMTPDNMLVTLVAQGVPTDDVERYYKAHFSYVEETGPAYASLLDVQPDPRWHVPAPNPFIPHNVALREPKGPLKLSLVTLHHLQEDGVPAPLLKRLQGLQGVTFTGADALIGRMDEVLSPPERKRWLSRILADAKPVPVQLMDGPQGRVWYQPDWRFRQPKADIVLKFLVDGAYASPGRAVLADLYVQALEEGLNELGYPMKEAGLSYHLRADKGGLVLSVGGYSARMLDVLHLLVGKLQRVSIDEDTFAALKERMRRGLQSQRYGQPYQQARYFSRLLLVSPDYTREALLAALEPLRLEDVKEYARTAFARSYLQGVVVGNLGQDEARAAVQDALATLGGGPLPESQRVEEQVRDLPPRADWSYSDRLVVDNSTVELLYQVGKVPTDVEMALSVIGQPLQEAFNHKMRTEQQLGYIVWAGVGQIHRVLNVYFLVQSKDYAPEVLEQRMAAFVPGFVQGFKSMPDEAFDQYRTAALRSRLERAQSLSEVAGRLFWSAFRNDQRFDFASEQVAALEHLTRADVENVLERYLLGQGKRRLAIRLAGAGHPLGRSGGQAVSLPRAVLGGARETGSTAPPAARSRAG